MLNEQGKGSNFIGKRQSNMELVLLVDDHDPTTELAHSSKDCPPFFNG